jgi:hypothetical protein
MSKAEDIYLELFQDGRLRNCSSKEAFLLGYHQAEKDNELTWENIKKIEVLCFRVDRECDLEEKEYYQEVLNRFKETKR